MNMQKKWKIVEHESESHVYHSGSTRNNPSQPSLEEVEIQEENSVHPDDSMTENNQNIKNCGRWK